MTCPAPCAPTQHHEVPQGAFPLFTPGSTFSWCLPKRVDQQSLQLQLEGIGVSVSNQAATSSNRIPIWDVETELCLFLTLDVQKHPYCSVFSYEANKLKFSCHVLWKDKKVVIILPKPH